MQVGLLSFLVLAILLHFLEVFKQLVFEQDDLRIKPFCYRPAK